MIQAQVTVSDSNPGFKTLLERLDFRGATHVDIGIHSVSGPDLVMIASVHEFGTDRAGRGNSTVIPARPFVRSSFDENRAKYERMGGELLELVQDGKISVRQALGLWGEEAQKDTRRKTVTLSDPPNAPATVAKKGYNDPLIDKGIMVNSIRYAIKTRQDAVVEMSSEGTYSPPQKQ